ncbi:hypothetical protein RD792_017592 [Penstemon davidsonii]|uniref:Cytochrome P450 n=1 Tax=Penstemon davidsonii TaxID=160366 RepID=A0ABR0CP04_9LAMI|nr:hypothetical protein RD792_017592 [Penstemon davidsonii]
MFCGDETNRGNKCDSSSEPEAEADDGGTIIHPSLAARYFFGKGKECDSSSEPEVEDDDEVDIDPTRFKPERHENGKGEGFMVPFGAGRRKCPGGVVIATRVLGLTLVTMIQAVPHNKRWSWTFDAFDLVFFLVSAGIMPALAPIILGDIFALRSIEPLLLRMIEDSSSVQVFP